MRAIQVGVCVAAVSAAAMSAMPAADAAGSTSIVKNGSFTKPKNGSGTFEAGTSIGAWSVTIGDVDLNGQAYNLPEGLPRHASSVDLNGFEQGAIAETIKTTPGQSYTLSYYLGGNPDGDPGLKSVTVSVAGVDDEASVDSTGTTPETVGWTLESVTFTATAKKTSLTLASDTPGTPYGPMVTGISAAPSVATS